MNQLSMTYPMRNIQDVFKSEREVWLDEARAAARRLLTRRHYITINDVLAETPRPSYLSKNITGAVFKNGDFKVYGFEKSKSKKARGRIICQWCLAEDKFPLTMKQIERARQDLY